jgi:hypothetical protein
VNGPKESSLSVTRWPTPAVEGGPAPPAASVHHCPHGRPARESCHLAGFRCEYCQVAVDARLSRMHVKAQVKNGRVTVDEPTNLPDGAEVEVLVIAGDDLDDEERLALHRSIEEGFEDFERGDVEDAFEFLARLKSQREDRDRHASPTPSRANK